VRWFISQFCGSLSALTSRSNVTSAAVANVVLARSAAVSLDFSLK
jgi:hypothetical protein